MKRKTKKKIRKLLKSWQREFATLLITGISVPLNKLDYLINRNTRHSDHMLVNYHQRLNEQAFSLIELILIVGIIGIVTASGVFGFGRLADVLSVKQVAGVAEETVRNAQLRVLMQKFDRSSLTFLPKFMVIESEPIGQGNGLSWTYDEAGCADGVQLDYNEAGTLTKKDRQGNVLEVLSVASGGDDCSGDFAGTAGSDEIEWQYELTNDGLDIGNLQLIHFNINREKKSANPVWVVAASEENILDSPPDYPAVANEFYSIVIEAPYANRYVAKAGDIIEDSVYLYFQDEKEAGDLETFNLRP